MNGERFKILLNYMEGVFGEPFCGYNYHDNDESNCADCQDIWLWHKNKFGESRWVHLDFLGSKAIVRLPDEEALGIEFSLTYDMADPNTNMELKKVLDALLRY